MASLAGGKEIEKESKKISEVLDEIAEE